MTDSADELLTEQRDHTLLITINRPQARNAVNGAVARAMAAALDRFEEDDDLRVAVLTGAGGTFSSGMDLKGFLTGDLPVVEGRGFGGLTERPPSKPLIAAVEGYALAGGCELVLACDLVVAAEDARFGVPEVKRGLVAAGGAALLLPQRIPRAAALEMLLTGDPVGAPRAHELGLVNRVVPLAELDAAVDDWARQLAAGPPIALAQTKALLDRSATSTLAQALEAEAAAQVVNFGTADTAEAIGAFLQKREPTFRGR